MLVNIPPRPLSYTKCVNGESRNTDKNTSNTIGQRAWAFFNEAPRQKWEENFKEIKSGAHQQHAQRGGASVMNANWEALGYKVSHDCLRVVCKTSQAILQNLKSQSEKSPKSPSSSEFNPFK